ncbi:LTA synthase family protein [Persicimonas caeni]|uniref:LTA synthase family protein n=1 Tax=Persicimonas caeni TaxID=2292766 RepID=A0A4Y6PXR8_PERCE|nr:LTA synthase family protein [Persicimonas caeni]QDG52787.1 LTA synthase family protein [Persicimonas caeni]QED34009.1 LTA synthase family protein [Persicimonas caeni]
MAKSARQLAWVAIPLSVLLGDFFVRWEMGLPANLAQSPSNLFASAGLSWLFWWAVSRLVSASERRWMWATVVALPAALLCASVWRFHLVAGHAPSPSVLVYFWQEPASSLRMMGTRLSPLFVGGVGALAGLWAFALAGEPRELDASLRRSCLLALVPWIFAAVFWPAGMTVGQSPFTADFHASHTVAHAAKALMTSEATSPLGVADRVDLPKAEGDAPRPNVIIIVAESLRRDRMQIFGHDRPTTPEMARFFDAHPDEIYRFDRALSASAYTQLSVPMILSGLYMARDRQTMHRAPLVWHYARAAGAQTFLVSPQQWSWQGLHDFMLLDAPPDHVVTAETLGADIINDVGVHDRLATDALVDLLRHKLDPERPFLGVVQTNATHFPFLPKDDVDWPLESIRDVYDASVALTDGMFGRMVQTLSERGLLEDTVIVFVADHSEFFYDVDADDREQVQKVWQDGLRVSSCHPSIARIPMFMYVPDKWAPTTSAGAQALRDNERRWVSTVDVVPTVLDLWDVEDMTSQAGLDGLDGESLLTPVDADRAAFCVNSARWNLRGGSGFAAFGNERIIYGRTDFEHLHVYDPEDSATWTERTPGRTPDERDRQWLDGLLGRHPALRPYLKHVSRGNSDD